MKSFLTLLLTFFLLFEFCSSQPFYSRHRSPKTPTHLQLAVQWPNSFWIYRDPKIPTRPVPQQFTIHGLWGCDSEGVLPECEEPVTSAQELKTEDISHIKPKLDDVWPNHVGNNFQFWKYEWEKHGRCLTGMSKSSYFRISVNLMEEIGSLADFFTANEFVSKPFKKYKAERFLTTLREKKNVVAEMGCIEDKNGESYLYEIYFCATPAGKLQNCTLVQEKYKPPSFFMKYCPPKIRFPPSQRTWPPLLPLPPPPRTTLSPTLSLRLPNLPPMVEESIYFLINLILYIWFM